MGAMGWELRVRRCSEAARVRRGDEEAASVTLEDDASMDEKACQRSERDLVSFENVMRLSQLLLLTIIDVVCDRGW